MVGNRQTNFFFGKETKWILLSNILFQTQQRHQIEQKLWHFEDNPVSRGGGGNAAENPEKATWPFVGVWHFFSQISPPIKYPNLMCSLKYPFSKKRILLFLPYRHKYFADKILNTTNSARSVLFPETLNFNFFC